MELMILNNTMRTSTDNISSLSSQWEYRRNAALRKLVQHEWTMYNNIRNLHGSNIVQLELSFSAAIGRAVV